MLEAIARCVVENGHPPTVLELQRALRLGSTRTVLRYLDWLEEDGDLRRWPGARGIQLLKRPKTGAETVAIPLVGEAPAGPLMVAEENREGWVRVPKEFMRPRNAQFFLLRVRGDSMNRAEVDGARIEDGDLVVVRQQAHAESGDIIVALVDGEVTIKRLRKGEGYYLLNPESTKREYEPIVLQNEFRIQGVVRKVLKKGSTFLEEVNS